TCGGIYWIYMQGMSNQYVSADTSKFWSYQCAPSGNCSHAAIDLTSAGSGTITITPYAFANPVGGNALLDSTGQQIYTNSSGAVTTAPITLLAQDFTYLTQRTKATPPYITALVGR